MARKKPPSFDFFPDDFLAGTYHLPAEAVGIYVRLLCYQWNNGSIPVDPEELARIAGCDANAMRTHMRTVMQKFVFASADSMQNERLEKERAHKMSVIEKAKASAERRWANKKPGKQEPSGENHSCERSANGDANAYANAMLPTSYFLLPTSEEDISHTHTHSHGEASEIVIPKELSDLWPKWTGHFLAKTGRMMSGVQQEVILMDLAKRGWDKARADIEFSIRIGASAVRDSDNDFDKPTRAGSGSSRSGSRKSKAERMNELL